VLSGLVARVYAGPSAVLSWAVAGAAACLSGCCYAELASRIPMPGSAYVYSYVAMGEYPAVVAATCLGLEYVFATAAVARSWGDKLAVLLVDQWGWGAAADEDGNVGDAPTMLVLLAEGKLWFNPLAFIIAAGTVGLLLSGIKESKRVTNFFTFVKISVVMFMIFVSFCNVQPKNWTPFLVHGWSGVFRGATTTFFGKLITPID